MVTIKNVLLTTQITALEVKLRYVFLGEGQYLHIHNLDTGNRLATHKVFEAAVVHGIKIRPVKDEASRSWVVGVWGQKSLAVLLYKFLPGNEICSLIEERRFEDWIIDAVLEDNLSHIVLATAHNSLIRYKLQYSKDLEEHPYQDTFLESEGNCLVHEGKEDCVQNKSHLDCNAIKTDTNSFPAKTELLTWKNTRWKPDRCVLVKVDCTENCILYCGHIVLMAGNWESAVLLAGTVFSQVLIWGPWCSTDPSGRVAPIHCLSGHEGVLFSINFSVAQGLLTTTSDDRTLRMWNIIPKYPLSDADSPPSLQLYNREQVQKYWLDAEITEKHICYGHGARVWQSLILSSCVVSVGEDSKVCVWDQQGKLITWWKAHDGSCVWTVAAAEDEGQLVTGGGDGSVKTWSLNITDSPKSEPLLNGPWCLTDKETPLIEKEHSKVIDASPQLPASENSEGHKAEMLKNGEFFEVINFEGTETTESCTKNNPNQLPKATDFPRCVALVGVNQFLLAMDSGRLFQWHSENATWTLVWDDPRMQKYVIMDTCSDQKKIAVGMLCGVVLIFRISNGDWEKHLEVTLCQGKVFSLQWLGSDRILACGPDGDIVTWSLLEVQGSLVKERNHTLPPCKQRWVSAACIVPSTVPGGYYLICGDRAGSLHLYHQEDLEPRQSIRGIHGKNGVTSLVIHEGFIYSSGRDGCVRQLKLFDESIQVLTVTRVSNVTWVAQVIFLQGRPLALCFHDVNLKLWNLAEDRAVVEVECGGGHRSWALHASRSDDQLVFFFLKDGIPCIFRTTLADKLMPLIKSPVNTRETMCLQTLFHVEGKTFFAMGGEDTTLRIHSVQGLESHRSLCVVRSHISNIRALCRIECQGAINPAGSDKSVWLVSGGGRAQMKLWEVTLNHISKRNLQNAGSGLQGKVPVAGSGEENSHRQEQAQKEDTSITCNSSREEMLNLGCREVTSHMIRTGNNKTWKSQELTFDPETRYMDATAFWVTDQLAVIVLASSDGILRVFVFSQCTEKVTLVCSHACDHCVLKVVRVPIQTRHILASAGTDGRVVFWDMKSIVNWLCTPDVAVNNPPPSLELHQLAFIQSHQSGVNSLSINYHSKPTDEKSYRSSLTLATGGDDNKLSVWDVIIYTSEDGFTKIDVQFLCIAIGHASQITGLEWISQNLLVSTSVDQRVVVWELCHTDSTRQQSETGTDSPGSAPQTYLRATCSAYTGVPDVKGLTVIPINKNSSNTNSETDLLQRLIVYGVGLQVYDLDTSVGEL
ncbi:WD repeat-containing protein 6-like isoform X2 [Penaeus chinensis]|uniref:WD repeat-containing protein 6-like isoform X2 n=1 Tax=Penaeus chinensis TaxID=139456 RepID=UPI001FB5E3D9|nr:WD repeat-containing protein 6-like isoform X2 [Penaeus chinensis]